MEGHIFCIVSVSMFFLEAAGTLLLIFCTDQLLAMSGWKDDEKKLLYDFSSLLCYRGFSSFSRVHVIWKIDGLYKVFWYVCLEG